MPGTGVVTFVNSSRKIVFQINAFLKQKEVFFCVFVNVTTLLKIWICGVTSIFLEYIYLHQVKLNLKGLHKRKEMVLLVGLYVNPVRNGILSKIPSKISNLDRLPFWTGLCGHLKIETSFLFYQALSNSAPFKQSIQFKFCRSHLKG